MDILKQAMSVKSVMLIIFFIASESNFKLLKALAKLTSLQYKTFQLEQGIRK